ncbi:MAG: hypothetical protein ACC661_12950, partial [Verrucomicrobiales bacterium]
GRAVVASGRQEIITEALFRLRALRSQLDPAVTDYADAAVDLIEELGKYLGMSNRDSSIAKQQAAVVEQMRVSIEGIREELTQ